MNNSSLISEDMTAVTLSATYQTADDTKAIKTILPSFTQDDGFLRRNSTAYYEELRYGAHIKELMQRIKMLEDEKRTRDDILRQKDESIRQKDDLLHTKEQQNVLLQLENDKLKREVDAVKNLNEQLKNEHCEKSFNSLKEVHAIEKELIVCQMQVRQQLVEIACLNQHIDDLRKQLVKDDEDAFDMFQNCINDKNKDFISKFFKKIKKTADTKATKISGNLKPKKF